MVQEKLLDLKFRVRHRLPEFLRAARLYLNESDPDHIKTSCPHCGQEVTVLKIPFSEPQYRWSCSFCGKSGDAVQYAMAKPWRLSLRTASYSFCANFAS